MREIERAYYHIKFRKSYWKKRLSEKTIGY